MDRPTLPPSEAPVAFLRFTGRDDPASVPRVLCVNIDCGSHGPFSPLWHILYSEGVRLTLQDSEQALGDER